MEQTWERSNKETCCIQKFKKFKKFREFLKLHIIFICLQQLHLTCGQSLFDRTTNLRPKSSGWLEWPLTRTTLCGVYSWTSHSKAVVYFGRDYMENLRSTKNQLVMSVKQLFHVTGNWSRIRQTSVVWPPLITKNLRGDRRIYYVTKRLGLRTSKPTSSPTRCSVCEVWVTNQSKPGRTKLNVIWKIAISRIWIESMESRWTSSGKSFQDSLYWAFLKEIRKFMTELQCELESSSKEGSSSCQCTTTLYEENEETQKNVRWNSVTVANYARRFLLGRWSFLGTGSEKKKYGNCFDKPDGDWDKTAERRDAQLCRKRSFYISCHQRPEKRIIKKQSKG